MGDAGVVIIDSGICNLFNVRRAFELIGTPVTITKNKRDILEASRVVLPGVGAFGAAMQSLEQCDLIGTIQKVAKSGKPLLGICLGMQLLMTTSEELGTWDGLDLIRGRVRIFKPSQERESRYKIPQIGWNFLERGESRFKEDPWEKTVLSRLAGKPYMYFVHSFVVEPEEEKQALAYTHYGRDKFCSVIKKNNVSGCQFHPERSGPAGLRILSNFLEEN